MTHAECAIGVGSGIVTGRLVLVRVAGAVARSRTFWGLGGCGAAWSYFRSSSDDEKLVVDIVI